MTRSILSSSLVALALVACGDNLPGADEPAEPTGRTLTGEHLVHHRHLDRALLSTRPVDLWDTVVEAHVPDGDGWRVRPGTGHRDGSFEIAGVPEGGAWIRLARRPFGDVFYWTTTDHLALDEHVVGPELPRSARDGDRLRLAIDGLAPWQDADELAWFVPDDLVFDANLVWSTPPAPDATTLADTSVDWTGRNLADVDPTDHALVVQYRTQTLAAGVDVRAPIRAATSRLRQEPGVDGTLDVSLTPPPVLRYRLAWAREEFEAQRTAAHPTRAGAAYGHGFSLIAIPGIVDGDLWLGAEYPVATLTDPSILEGSTPLDLGELEIPNPFPRDWLADLYVVNFPVELPLPDGTPVTLEAVLGMRRAELSTTTGPATPFVTALRAPRLAGRDAFTALAGVGTTPELAWSPPAIGTPTAYHIKIIEAYTHPPEPYRPGWYIAAELMVPGDVTSVRLPADLLREGATYGAVIRTFAQPGQDVATQPFRTRGTAGFADAILGPFTP